MRVACRSGSPPPAGGRRSTPRWRRWAWAPTWWSLSAAVADCTVVGDAVWDLLAARRAGMLSVGLLTGGYGEDELARAGAFRVYRDAADLHASIDELGI